jgi:hypothetical protein
MVGRALLARLEMLKAYDRQEAAHKYQASRQVPVRDAQGQDHAKSLRQVEPRTVAEAVIRYVIDKPERKQEREAVRAAVIDQVNLAEREFGGASDYLGVRLRMAANYCKAAGVRPTEVAPILNEDQIREIKEYAGKLRPYSSQSREFERAIPLAERALKDREAERSRVVSEMLGIRHGQVPNRQARYRQAESGPPPERATARSNDIPGAARAAPHAPNASGAKTVQPDNQLFQMDRNNSRQQAGIARGEQMVRAIEYSRTMSEAPHSREIALMLQDSRRALPIIDTYRAQTGRDPAPILTAEQRDFLRCNQDVLDSRAREELRQGLDRAVIHLESGKDTPLDHAIPDHAREQVRSNQQEQRDRGDSSRGR